MGVLATSDETLHTKLKYLQNGSSLSAVHLFASHCSLAPVVSCLLFNAAIGAVPAPFDCYMAMRGMKTLHVRCVRAQQPALIDWQLSEINLLT